MGSQHPLLLVLGLIVLVSPLSVTIVLGISSLIDAKLSEQTTAKLIFVSIVSGLCSSIAILILMLASHNRHIAIELGDWVVIAPHYYHFSVKFVFDRLSVPFVILTFVLSGTIAAFATRYMHREPGYNRFFVLYAIFVLGMIVASLAGTIETLFTGWELVGLSSALLVAFFQERPAPSRNGLWVWIVYRVSDAALLLAAVVLHHLTGEGDFDKLLGAGSWPYETSLVTSDQALLVGMLLLVSAAGKSALVPFSGWLPRAMEGPTPSSAVFYGALSVHLGAFLLLRVSPLMERSFMVSAAIILLGLVTALFAYLACTVQTDIKSALSFASLSQVGLIVAEIGLADALAYLSVSAGSQGGLLVANVIRYLALIHILGHACLRTLQFVRAPTLLLDYHTLENAIGEYLPQTPAPLGRISASRSRSWLYRFAVERGYLDALMMRFVIMPYVRAFSWCDALERRWTDFLTGKASRESDMVKPHFGSIEELS
jgi:NAD(P)H-quinone oxidoreductase subunit 5